MDGQTKSAGRAAREAIALALAASVGLAGPAWAGGAAKNAIDAWVTSVDGDAKAVGDAPRARTLQERKWKRAQNLGPWGPWSAEADAELRATADEARCGMVYAGVKT